MLLHRVFNNFSHALVDQVLVEILPDRIDATPIVPPGLENDTHLMPLLVELGSVKQAMRPGFFEWYESYLDEYGNSPIGTWLCVDTDHGALTAHLAKQLVTRLRDNKRYVLRYYDPKVFAHLRWILTPTQLRRLFGPIVKWTYAFEGRWKTLSSPDVGVAPPEPLDKTQSQRLLHTAAINKVLRKLEPTSDRKQFEARARNLSDYVARAQSYGWQAERDWVTFASLCATRHPNFDQHAAVQTLIRDMDHDDANFTDAAALVDEETWRVIVNELNGQGNIPSELHDA